MKIKLKTLRYDFRGQKQSLTFSGRTLISGKNGSGKSTTLNALLWLLTGADLSDTLNFNLFDNRTSDSPENPKIAEVSALFEIDGQELKLAKVAKQVWKRPRGGTEYKRGNDTYTYFVNDLETPATDFAKLVEETFGKGQKLKLMLNTDFWEMLTEKALRDHFLALVGEIDDTQFTQADYTPVRDLIHEKGVEDARKVFMNRIRELKEAQTKQKAALEAETEGLTDTSEVATAEARISALKAERESIDAQLLGLAHANDEYVAKRKQEEDVILAKEQELRKAEYEYLNEYDKKHRELETQLNDALGNNRNLEATEANLKRQIEDCESRINTLEIRRQEKLNELQGIMNRQFEATCPNCGANLEGKNYADSLAKFKSKKNIDQQVVLTQGQKIKHDLDTEKERLPLLKEQLNAVEKIDTKPIREAIAELECNHIPWYNTDIAKNLQSELETLKANRTQAQPNPDVEKGQIRKGEIDTELSELYKIIALRDIREKQEAKIAELNAKLKQTAEALAENEKMKMLVESYQKEQSEVIRIRANQYFDEVTVEMEVPNKSGEMVPCCKLRVGGVIDTANTASRTRIGYEVSRAFQRFYERTLPMFFDRAESLNAENVPQHEGQVVLLKVDEGAFRVEDYNEMERGKAFEDELAMRRPG